MAWTTPMTAVAGAFTAAQWNTYVRDNLNATEVAVASAYASGAQWFAATGANALALRDIKTAFVVTEQTTTSTTYTNLATTGPSITMTTGTKVIVQIAAKMGNDTVNAATQATFDVSGATTSTGGDDRAIISDGLENATAGDNIRIVSAACLLTVNAGSNTFTMKYKCSSGTGRFTQRRIVVWSF